MIKKLLKTIYLRSLFLLPHNNIYSFHCISDDVTERQLTGRWIDEEQFKDFVRTHGPYLSVEDILNRDKLDGHAALTFDDGLADVYTVAYPFLKQEGIPFTFFPLTDKLDQPGYMTTEQLKEMAADPLVTVGSHGISHLHLARENEETQDKELSESKKTLEALTGKICRIAAYPFGDFNQTTEKIMNRTGYTWGLAVKGRPLLRKRQGQPYGVPRLSIDRTTEKLYWHS